MMMKAIKLLDILNGMPGDLEVRVTHSGEPQILQKWRIIKDEKVLAFNVDYTYYPGSRPDDRKLLVWELRRILRDLPEDYKVGILGWAVDGGYEGALDGTHLNSMTIDTVQVAKFDGREYACIDTNDNDDEERYGRTIKIAA